MIIKGLSQIQAELKAPKSNYNSFSKFRYRSCEDILTAVKPLLIKHGCQLVITDDIVMIGTRYYVKATATITDSEGNSQSVSAFARESEEKKGLDSSQMTGSASSYCRKFCLNGLFLTDDTADADTDIYHKQTQMADSKPKFTKEWMKEHGSERIGSDEIEKLKNACLTAGSNFSIDKALKACKREKVELLTNTQYLALMTRMNAVA